MLALKQHPLLKADLKDRPSARRQDNVGRTAATADCHSAASTPKARFTIAVDPGAVAVAGRAAARVTAPTFGFDTRSVQSNTKE